MAEKVDVSAITNNYQRGAGDRLGRILEETRPVWMGRMRPIPGDQHIARVPRDELERIRRSLVEALEIIERLTQ